MEEDLEVIKEWVEEREKRRKKKKGPSVKYFLIIIVTLVLIVIVWILVNYTFKKDKILYEDMDTGEIIDIEKEKEMGVEIIYQD